MSKGFKSTYLRLLSGEAVTPNDYWAARELIDSGYAQGQYRVSKSHLDYGQITALVGFTPTMQGRLYADQLKEEMRRSTLRYRLKQGAFGLLSFGAGWFFGVFNQVAANLITKLLGA